MPWSRKCSADGHGGVGCLAAEERRRIARRDDDDRARESCRPELVLDELAHLPAALTDEGEHGDVACRSPGEHGHERALADAGAGEQPETLPLPARGEEVERAHAEVDPGTEPGAASSLGRRGADRPQRAVRQRSAAVQRAPERVHHPAKPSIADAEAAATRISAEPQEGWAALPQALERGESHRLGASLAEADDLRREQVARAALQRDAIAHGGLARETGNLHGEAGYGGDPALQFRVGLRREQGRHSPEPLGKPTRLIAFLQPMRVPYRGVSGRFGPSSGTASNLCT